MCFLFVAAPTYTQLGSQATSTQASAAAAFTQPGSVWPQWQTSSDGSGQPTNQQSQASAAPAQQQQQQQQQQQAAAAGQSEQHEAFPSDMLANMLTPSEFSDLGIFQPQYTDQ